MQILYINLYSHVTTCFVITVVAVFSTLLIKVTCVTVSTCINKIVDCDDDNEL